MELTKKQLLAQAILNEWTEAYLAWTKELPSGILNNTRNDVYRYCVPYIGEQQC